MTGPEGRDEKDAEKRAQDLPTPKRTVACCYMPLQNMPLRM
jgi:hypothetical protein